MHRPPFSWAQWRTRPRSRSTARTRALENWLPWHRTSRDRARSRSLSARRSRPDRRLVYRTRPRMRNDHARRRHVRTLSNRSRRFRCCRWRLWRSSRRCCRRSWRRSLCHRWRYRLCLRGWSRHWDRWGRCGRHRWVDNWRRRSGKRRPYGRLRNNDPRRRRGGRNGRRRRSFHRRNRWCCR
jgi:hypothetical protein